MITDDIKELFETLISPINVALNLTLKPTIKTYYNYDLEELIVKTSIDNSINLAYMGADPYNTTANGKRSLYHSYAILIANRKSLEVAFWINQNTKDTYIINERVYKIGFGSITPLGTLDDRFLKTTMELFVYE
jgi:hypothetical protein